MNNPPDLDALRYLLDDLDAESRAAFAERLAQDPAAERELREAREALAAFATAAAPAEALPAADQRRVLDRVMAVVDSEPRRRLGPRFRRRWAWPLAACLLLGLNLWQFTRPADDDRAGPSTTGAEVAADTDIAESEAGATTVADADAAEATNETGSALAGDAAELAAGGPINIGPEELRRLREIRVEYEQLAADNDRLREEHTEILRQLAAYALTARGVNRLAAMELVDPESYAAGERKGLLDFALNLLTEPGIIALEPDTTAAGNDVPSGDPAIPGGDDDLDAANQPPGSNGPGSETDGDQTSDGAVSRDPYAWSVFDETQHRGFLNLYNLPTPPAGQTLQLWVRSAVDTAYTRVGEVPEQYFGGSGSITYRLPGENQPPAEILITQEPVNAPPGQPTGEPVLRGP